MAPAALLARDCRHLKSHYYAYSSSDSFLFHTQGSSDQRPGQTPSHHPQKLLRPRTAGKPDLILNQAEGRSRPKLPKWKHLRSISPQILRPRKNKGPTRSLSNQTMLDGPSDAALPERTGGVASLRRGRNNWCNLCNPNKNATKACANAFATQDLKILFRAPLWNRSGTKTTVIQPAIVSSTAPKSPGLALAPLWALWALRSLHFGQLGPNPHAWP